MEDDNGLNLSLSLPYGGQTTSSKVNNGSCSEGKPDKGSSKLIDDFKNFLDCGNQKEDYSVSSHRNYQVKPEENLFFDLSSSTSKVQETKQDTGSKRKNIFNEVNHKKRHEFSTAENEDVADSEPVIPATLPLMFLKDSHEHKPTINPGNQVRAEGSLTPGIGAELRFGGSGSSPDLPWVSATGRGPNGKTISGVTYKHDGTHVRVVCACHGSHMSVEEFVQHASEEKSNATSGLSLFPNSSPAASAQS